MATAVKIVTVPAPWDFFTVVAIGMHARTGHGVIYRQVGQKLLDVGR